MKGWRDEGVEGFDGCCYVMVLSLTICVCGDSWEGGGVEGWRGDECRGVGDNCAGEMERRRN